MYSTWLYKTNTSYYEGNLTGSDGAASCQRYISDATVGYTVRIEGYGVSTSFTPRDREKILKESLGQN